MYEWNENDDQSNTRILGTRGNCEPFGDARTPIKPINVAFFSFVFLQRLAAVSEITEVGVKICGDDDVYVDVVDIAADVEWKSVNM